MSRPLSTARGGDANPLPALAGIAPRAWLVGGALRDRLLGRGTIDYDVALGGDARVEHVARALARDAGGYPFRLSDEFGAWRVVSHQRGWQVDLLALGAETIKADLALRDLTVNAIAEPLAGGELIDPFGGLRDLAARRLRAVSPTAFARDPLRTIRLARLACELGFAVEPDTAALATSSAPELASVAPERIFAELGRIVSAEGALGGLAVMDALEVTDAVLPELARLRGVRLGDGDLDLYEHARAVLAQTIELERDPEPALGSGAPAVVALLARPLAGKLTRGQALRFGALLGEVGRPQTRRMSPEGKVTSAGHDEAGAAVVRTVLRRLRAGQRLGEHVAALSAHHRRLGLLVDEMPVDRRAIYGYLRACSPVQVDVTLLSVADRLARRGSHSDSDAQAVARHLELARRLLGEALAWLSDPPRPPVRGDELARALGIAPGPALGRLLAELEQAKFAGEVATREQVLQRARELLAEAL
ncbi:MAG: hypothetical protein ACR2IP_07465 [Solirubrobacteraceae bacterium]